jgi:hypothetical protein
MTWRIICWYTVTMCSASCWSKKKNTYSQMQHEVLHSISYSIRTKYRSPCGPEWNDSVTSGSLQSSRDSFDSNALLRACLGKSSGLDTWDGRKFDVHGTVHRILLSITNKMQHYTILFITVRALHISGGFSAHHQELKSVYTVSGICQACCYVYIV